MLAAASNVHSKGQQRVLEASELMIRAGKYNLDVIEKGSLVMNASEVIVHPDWNPDLDTWAYDVAIILFDYVVELSARIQPIPLPTSDVVDDNGFVV